MFTRIQNLATAAMVVISLATPALAADTVLSVTHQGQTKTFDMATLDAMGTQTVETTTIWTEGVQTFEGVSLHLLLQEMAVGQGMLRATAINDYSVEIPTSDAVENGPIVAMRLNGNEMSVRDKGPLWIIYPYDSDAEYQTEVIYSRSIWQLDRIEIVE